MGALIKTLIAVTLAGLMLAACDRVCHAQVQTYDQCLVVPATTPNVPTPSCWPLQVWNYTHIASATTTTPKSQAGILHTICINTPNAGTITVDDATSATTPNIAIIKAGAAASTPVCLTFDVMFKTGLTIVTSSTDDISVSWQ